ncbi:hypothetical protein GCM10027612_14470 [Microbispora bryophytorum subsp. camponoti]
MPADAVLVDKDQVLTCGEDEGENEGEGSAQALCDAIAAAASPTAVSPPRSHLHRVRPSHMRNDRARPLRSRRSRA